MVKWLNKLRLFIMITVENQEHKLRLFAVMDNVKAKSKAVTTMMDNVKAKNTS